MRADALGVEEGGDDAGYLCGEVGGSMDQRSVGLIARQACPLQVVMDDMRPITGVVRFSPAMFGFQDVGTVKVKC